jgi:hypothetical protein
MTERPPDRARKIFFDYEGSRFYMSWDGVDVEYERYSVPQQLERKWLEELTASRLDMLDRSGNWRVVHFLWHHGDSRHLARLIQAKPLCAFWERCAYLEELVVYIRMCSPTYAIADIHRAVAYVLGQAQSLERVAPDEKFGERVRRLIRSARDLRSA